MDVTACYPKVKYRSKSSGSVSNAGMLLLTETARALGLVEALEVELGGFMRPNAVHRPGKAVCDLAGDSGTAIAGIAAARARPVPRRACFQAGPCHWSTGTSSWTST